MGPSRRVVIGLTVAALASAAVPAAASADHDDDDGPEITRAPALSGSAYVGSRLDAVGASWSGRPTLTVYWRWLRCGHPTDWRSCELIDRAWSSSYTATSSDLGKRLRVVLWISNRDGDAYALSPASAAVANPPQPPQPQPEPQPPQPTPSPQPSPPVAAPPPSVSPPAPVVPAAPVVPTPPAVAAPRLMRPTPMVRVRGWLTLRGAQITLLTVRAPRQARISVRCTGIGCPRVAPAQSTKLTRLRRYEGMFRGGSRLVIRVTRPGFIGKHTVIRIRRGKAPLRRDRCLIPAIKGPTACPAA